MSNPPSTQENVPAGVYTGRMRRLPYVITAPLAFVLPVALPLWYVFEFANIDEADFKSGFPILTVVLAGSAVAQLLLTSIPVARRLNDTGLDRSFVALLLIPALNVMLIIVLMFIPSTKRGETNDRSS